jgi:hypothetical protein
MAQLLAKVWRPLLEKFGRTAERACLRRDAYLDRVLDHEAKRLKAEVPRPNSNVARAYLKGALDDLDRAQVNFSLSPLTIAAVNRACKELNVIRDCFVNRVLFLLTADITICEAVTAIPIREHLPDLLGNYDRDYIYTPLWGGSLQAISEIVDSDPFWALRNIIDHFRQIDDFFEPLHACQIVPEMFPKKPPEVIALNCYMPDEGIPDSPAAKRIQKELEELLGKPAPGKSAESKERKGRRKAP